MDRRLAGAIALGLALAVAAGLGYQLGARRVAQVEATARAAAAVDAALHASAARTIAALEDSARVRDARYVVQVEALRAQAARVRAVVRTVRLADTIEVAAALESCDALALACAHAADSGRGVIASQSAVLVAQAAALDSVPARLRAAVAASVAPVLAERDAARAALRRRTWLPRVGAGAACLLEGTSVRCGPAMTLGWGVWP